MLGRGLLTLAGLMLVGTAILHGIGAEMVTGWLRGERGLVLELLWHSAGLSWLVVGLAWVALGLRGEARVRPLVWLLALIPAGAAAMIASALGPDFLPLWLLAGATLLALAGSFALPRVSASPGAPSP